MAGKIIHRQNYVNKATGEVFTVEVAFDPDAPSGIVNAAIHSPKGRAQRENGMLVATAKPTGRRAAGDWPQALPERKQ